MPGEAAQYELALALSRPQPRPPRPYCAANDRFCASAMQREANAKGVGPLTTAAESRPVGLVRSAARGSGRGGARRHVCGGSGACSGVQLPVLSAVVACVVVWTASHRHSVR